MKQLPSAEKKADYVIAHGWARKGEDPKIFREMVLRSKNDIADGMYQDVRFALTDGRDGVLDLSDPGSKGVRNRAADALNNYALTRGSAGVKQISTVKGARAVARIPGVMPLNLDEDSIDLAVVRVAEAKRDSGYAYKLKKNSEQRNPADAYWRDTLANAVARRPDTVEGIVNKMVELQKDPNTPADVRPSPSFFPDLDEEHKKLSDHVIVSYSHDELAKLAGRISVKDSRTNKPVGVSPAMMRIEMAKGNMPLLAMLKDGWADGAFPYSKWLEQSIAMEPIVEGQTLMKNAIPNLNDIQSDPVAMGEFLKHPFLIATGQEKYDLAEAFNAYSNTDFAPPAPSTPLLVGQTPTPVAKPTPTIPVPGVPAALTMDFPAPSAVAQGNFAAGRIQFSPAVQNILRSQDITPTTYARTTPHRTPYAMVKSALVDYARDSAVNPGASLAGHFWSNMFYTPVVGQDESGNIVLGRPELAINPAQVGSAINTFGQVAGQLGAYERGDPADSAFSGLGTAVGVAGAWGMLFGGVGGAAAGAGGLALASNPTGWVVAAGLGIAAGLKSAGIFGKKKNSNQEYEDMRRAAAAAQAARYEEQRKENERVQDIRNLQSREQALARSVGGMTPEQRARIEPHLAAYKRKPTYQSRIGLVDAAERAVGSAIKPRW